MRRILRFFIIISIIFIPICSVFSEDSSFKDIMQAGKEEMADGNYLRAMRYFQIAQQLDADAEEPRYYINLIKRAQDDRVYIMREQSSSSDDIAQRRRSVSYALDRTDTTVEMDTSSTAPSNKHMRALRSALDSYERKEDKGRVERKKYKKIVLPKPQAEQSSEIVEETPKLADTIKKQTRNAPQAVEHTFNLTTSSLASFPVTADLFIDQSFVVKSSRIKRWLVVSPGVIDVQRLDAQTIRVSGISLGPTVFHVWDDVGRWTFTIQVVPLMRYDPDKSLWEKAEGFKFYYENNWRAYYDGVHANDMRRTSLIFDQDAGFEGPTPYGDLDSSVQWSYAGEESIVKGYTVGLSAGSFFMFNKFNVRGFDFSQSLSPLTFPGTTLRGVYWNTPMFNNGLEYTLFWGSDKRSYGYLSSNLISEQDSYIEGAQVKFFPKAKNTVVINYAKGHGDDREDYLKDKVYSAESSHDLGHVNILNEVARDDSNNAATTVWTARMGKFNARASYRDISKDFLTISGRPSNSAEIGGTFGFDWRPTDKFYFSSDLDVYRDRENFNNGFENGLNYDWNGASSLAITDTSALSTNIYYSNDPQLSFPQRNLSANAALNKTFELDLLGPRTLATYAGYAYQKSINPLSPAADYRRDSVLTGARLSLLLGLYAYSNYTYSWVRDLESGMRSTPSVVETGLDYYRDFGRKLSSNWRVYYRKENDVVSIHSFLSGEDSVEGSFSWTYRPYENIQFFLDGRLRRIWPHDEDPDSRHIEGDVRIGTRIDWDSFITWAPLVTVDGIVFKDANGNGKLDKDETGCEGIKIVVGPTTATTDKNGHYRANVRARSVVATVNVDTVPKGYVMTTNSSVKLDTSRGGAHKLNFGISSQSGIYGLVFYDANGDGKFNPSTDKVVNKARITLDGKKVSSTNSEGTYFFGGLLSGKYTLALDVNSLPMEYIPASTIRQSADLQEGATIAVYFPLKKR